MFHQHSSRTTRGLLLAAAATVLYGSAGCTAVSHYMHHHGPVAVGDSHHHSPYFHCPECGRIVPKGKKHACRHTGLVLPCFGYEPTCWRPWPAGCNDCPEFCEEVEILEGEILYEHPIGPATESVHPVPPTPAAGHHSASPSPRLLKSASNRERVSEPAVGEPAAPVAQPLRSVIPASSREVAIRGDDEQTQAAQSLFPALHFADPSMWASE